MADEFIPVIDDNLEEILKSSIQELRSEENSELKSKYNIFQNLYFQLQDESRGFLSSINSLAVGALRNRGNMLNSAYFSAESGRTVAKLMAFTKNHQQKDFSLFLQLQQVYEDLVSLILHLPMPTVLILYTDKESGLKVPLISQNFNDYEEGITNKYNFGKKVEIQKTDVVKLKDDFLRNQKDQMLALAEQNKIINTNLQLLSKHYDFYDTTIQTYAKRHARQSHITEAFFKHFYNIDYFDANFYQSNSIIVQLAENNLPHFGGVGNMFVLYHEAQGNDPTFTGQDVVTKLVNVQIKNAIDDPKKGINAFDLAKTNLITNFYLFVSTVLLDSSIDINEAARAAVIFFKQENRDIEVSDALEKYTGVTAENLLSKNLKIKK